MILLDCPHTSFQFLAPLLQHGENYRQDCGTAVFVKLLFTRVLSSQDIHGISSLSANQCTLNVDNS